MGAIENVKQSGQLRMTPMARGRGARSKGGAAEREVVELLKAHGWLEARRNFRSGADGGADITGGPADTSWEIKRQERVCIWEWLQQAAEAARPTDTPIVAFRRNRSEWLAVLPLEDLLSLLELREIR